MSHPYRDAAQTFWPDHASLLYDSFDVLNELCFDGQVPMAGIVVGLTPYGSCYGYTDCRSGLITLHPSTLSPASGNPWGIAADALNEAFTVDVLLHEMLHSLLLSQGHPNTKGNPHHNQKAWAEHIVRLSPQVLQESITASPWKRARRCVGEGGSLYYAADAGSISRDAMAAWPHSLRPIGYYTTTATPWFSQASAAPR